MKRNILTEVNRMRTMMGLNLLREQKIDDVIVVDGERMKITDLIKSKLPKAPYEVGQKFESGKYILSTETQTDLKNAANQMAEFFNLPEISNVMFNIELAGSASKVPISKSLAKTYGISYNPKTNNQWLATRRAKSVQDALSKLLKAKGVTNVTFPEPTITVKGPDYVAGEDVHLDKYKQHQSMKIIVKGGGKKMVLEALPKFCEEKMDAEQGKVGNPNRCFKVYPGKGKKLELGEGEGKICLSFDALTVPDMFDLNYNGKLYRSKNVKTGKEGFISQSFKQLSPDKLEEYIKKIPELEKNINELANTITKEEEVLAATGPAQVEKLKRLLQEEATQMEERIKDMERRIAKYSHLGVVAPDAKWSSFIEHYRGFPNKLVPNEYWEEIELVKKKGKKFAMRREEKEWDWGRPNEFYNLSKEGELDLPWFEKFFESFPISDEFGGLDMSLKQVRKTPGYKKLYDNRASNVGRKQRDDLAEFYKMMWKYQIRAKKLKAQKIDFLTKTADSDRKSYITRIANVESNVEKETARIEKELKNNIKKYSTEKSDIELKKKQREMNVKSGGSGTWGWQEVLNEILGPCYEKKGQEVPPVIGDSATITFDKIVGENEAWLQIHAPIGTTLWGLQVACGEEACSGLEQNPYKYAF